MPLTLAQLWQTVSEVHVAQAELQKEHLYPIMLAYSPELHEAAHAVSPICM